MTVMDAKYARELANKNNPTYVDMGRIYQKIEAAANSGKYLVRLDYMECNPIAISRLKELGYHVSDMQATMEFCIYWGET